MGHHQWSNLDVTGVLEGGENRAKDTYEELMGNYFWKLMKEDPGTILSKLQ